MDKIIEDLIKQLESKEIKLIYGMGDFPVSISFPEGTIDFDCIEEIKHISRSKYNAIRAI